MCLRERKRNSLTWGGMYPPRKQGESSVRLVLGEVGNTVE